MTGYGMYAQLDDAEVVELHARVYAWTIRLFGVSIDLTEQMAAERDDTAYDDLAARQRAVMSAGREQNDLYEELRGELRARSEARKAVTGAQ